MKDIVKVVTILEDLRGALEEHLHLDGEDWYDEVASACDVAWDKLAEL